MRIVLALILVASTLISPVSAQEPYDGQTLISLLTSNETYLIDIDFNIVKTWHGTNPPATIVQLLPDGSIFRPCIDPDAVFGLAGGGGRLQFIDANDVITWDYIFSDETKRQHHDAEPMPNGNTLICETLDRNIFEVTMDGTKVWQYTPSAAVHRAPRYWYDIVGIKDAPAQKARTLQNHPNPFNPQTTITFRVPATGRVRVDVYDIAGRHIATPLDALRSAGPHNAVWDGRDSQGRPASSGVYFYKLTAPGLVQTSKMVLTKRDNYACGLKAVGARGAFYLNYA